MKIAILVCVFVLGIALCIAIPLFIGYQPFLSDRLEKERYAETRDFDSSRWQQPDLKYRFSVLKEVASNRIKAGMSATEVKTILGSPDFVTKEGNWQYETRRPGKFNLGDGGGLLVFFSPELKVSSTEINHWDD